LKGPRFHHPKKATSKLARQEQQKRSATSNWSALALKPCWLRKPADAVFTLTLVCAGEGRCFVFWLVKVMSVPGRMFVRLVGLGVGI